MLKVAIAGLGVMGQTHESAWKNVSDAEVTAVFDAVPELLEKYSYANAYTDFDKMLEKEELDIIDICLPTTAHTDFSLRAMKKGINVICEKPISLNREDVSLLYETAEKNNVKFMVAQCVRFTSPYEILKKIYETKRFGALLSGEMRRLGKVPGRRWMLDPKLSGGVTCALHGWMHLKDPIFAQMLYKINGDSTEGLHYDITEPDPERLEDEVRDVIEQYGTYKFKTDMMTNFGFAILRDGDDFSSSANASSKDTRRDTWMYFGTSLGAHPHQDTLNLGMTAFGLNYMPDLGYPARTGDDPNRDYWIDTTLSHNTVFVDEKRQDENGEIRGKVKHFDGKDGTVSLMDVSAPYVYSGERANSAKVDEYRRSVVQIHVDAENSYMVDFFRVLGGNSHIYSLHATSDEIASVSGLDLTPQMKDGKYVGSYAGPDVPYGEEMVASYPMGYTWIKNVDRDEDPENKIEIDFAIKDFNRSIEDS